MGRLQETRQAAGARPEYLNEIGMIFGAIYESKAIVPDGSPRPAVANPVTDYLPSGRPGGRAPHAWLGKSDGERISTIDLVGNDFVLFAGSKGEAWLAAAAKLGLALKTVPVGPDGLADVEGHWHKLYGVEPTGAVLVRPDGYVGWRSASLSTDPATALAGAFHSILGHA
jgi:hypothetical protein